MPSIQIELFKSKILSNGHHPVCIRVTHNGKRKRKAVASCMPEDWDDENKKIKVRARKDSAKIAKINREIEGEFDRYETRFKELKKSGREWKAEDVFIEQKENTDLFIENSLSYLAYLEEKNYNTYINRLNRHNKILGYVKDRDFSIASVNRNWIEGLTIYLQKLKRPNGPTAIKDVFGYIKKVAKRAGVENKELNKIQTTPGRSIKNKLNSDDIKKLSEAHLSGLEHHARNTFLLAFYFRGIRIADFLLLRPENIKNGRVVYISRKSKKPYDIKIIPKAAEILKEYIKDEGYLLPWIRFQYSDSLPAKENNRLLDIEIVGQTASINYYLKKIAKIAGIDKKISTHISRHSFASYADKKLSGDIKSVQEMLGHTKRQTTEDYVKELRQTDELDDAADKIFG